MDDEGRRTPRRRPRTTAELQEQIRATRSDIADQVRHSRAQFDEANARIAARTGRNLIFAIVIGLALGAALVLSLVFAKQLFLIVAVVLVGFGTYELAGALRHTGIHVPRVGSAAAAVLAQPVAYFAMVPGADGQPVLAAGWLLALVGAVLLAMAWRVAEEALSRTRRGPLARDLASTAFVQLYVTGLGTCATVLTAQNGGQWWTLSFVCVVVATDVFAYFSGLLFGKHPMAPTDQPEEDLGGLRRGGGRGDRRRVRAVAVAARPSDVVRPHLRGDHPALRHARRPRRVDDQARHRGEGHLRAGCRVTAGSSTGSTRSFLPPRRRCCCSSSRADGRMSPWRRPHHSRACAGRRSGTTSSEVEDFLAAARSAYDDKRTEPRRSRPRTSGTPPSRCSAAAT